VSERAAGAGGGDTGRPEAGAASSLGVAEGLGLPATPTFALMAVLTVAHHSSPGGSLLGRARSLAARRHGADVRADERLPFGAVAEADLEAAKASTEGVLTTIGEYGSFLPCRSENRCCS
jgi:hypothetical protein